MIDDNKFEKVRKYLYLESVYPLLHETSKDKIDDILMQGLNLEKSYNGEIDRVVSLPQKVTEFKNYNYYTDKIQKTILVLGIPKIILGDIPINSSNGHLLLNCITEFQKPKPINPSIGFQFHELKFQRLPSKIPIKWMLGHFDEDSNFFSNPNYIMSQENSDELIDFSKKELLDEFHRRYPAKYLQLFGNTQETPITPHNLLNLEPEGK